MKNMNRTIRKKKEFDSMLSISNVEKIIKPANKPINAHNAPTVRISFRP